jgi:uncharacterized protein YegJ (DUF2314 family)
MRTLFAAFALTIGLLACGQAQQQSQAAEDDPVEMFAPDDATMNAAIAEARAGLPRFWELFQNNDGADFMLKVGFPTPGGGNEHIWVSDIQRSDAGITAVVQNDPVNVPSLQHGARAPIDDALISDWSLTRNGKTYGHYTTRVVVASLPLEEQAQYAEFLASVEQGVP